MLACTEELMAAKEELEKAANIFVEKAEEVLDAHNFYWCSFPEIRRTILL